MQATISFSSTELSQDLIDQIRLFLNGRSAQIIVQIEAAEPNQTTQPIVVQYVFSQPDAARLAAAEAFYKDFQIDLSQFKFDRTEANER